jgi:hypothetical protein
VDVGPATASARDARSDPTSFVAPAGPRGVRDRDRARPGRGRSRVVSDRDEGALSPPTGRPGGHPDASGARGSAAGPAARGAAGASRRTPPRTNARPKGARILPGRDARDRRPDPGDGRTVGAVLQGRRPVDAARRRCLRRASESWADADLDSPRIAGASRRHPDPARGVPGRNEGAATRRGLGSGRPPFRAGHRRHARRGGSDSAVRGHSATRGDSVARGYCAADADGSGAGLRRSLFKRAMKRSAST